MTDDYRYVQTKEISCDGNGSADGLGHPRVFLNLGKEGRVDCTYCGRIFIYQGKTQSSQGQSHSGKRD